MSIRDREESPVAVSVIVPAHNEARALSQLIHRTVAAIERTNRTFELVIVDDASDDESIDVLERKRGDDPRIVVHRLSRRKGQHAALREGFRIARGRSLVTLDADCQVGPEEIPRLLLQLDRGFDVVSGVRWQRNVGPARRTASRVSRALFGCLSGLQNRDWGSAFRAYSSDAAAALLLRPELTLVLPDLLDLLGYRSRRIEVDEQPRHDTPSRYKLFRLTRLGWEIVCCIVRLRWALRRSRATAEPRPQSG